MKVKISFIIPVYNAENYLDECINSIINQKYQNIEIILVNDGSTDNSLNICKKYQKKDKRIIIIDKKNEGVSKARNTGIEKSTGDLIMFIDSDDYYGENLIETILPYANNDLICFGYNRLFQNKSEKIVSNDIVLNTLSEVEFNILTTDYIGGFIATKVFSSDIIKKNNLKFDEKLHYCEDLFFVTEYVKHCKKYCYINKALYNYRMRQSSASFSFLDKKNVSILEAYKRLINKYNTQKEILLNLKYKYLLNYYKLQKFIDKNNKDILWELFKEESKILKSQKLTIKEQINFQIIKRWHFMYVILKKIKDKKLKLYN